MDAALGTETVLVHLLQVNQKLIKYLLLLFRVWRPYRSALGKKALHMWQTLPLFTQIPPNPVIQAKFLKKQLAGCFSKQ